MAKLFNRAKMTTATTGASTITLGSAVNGFQTFADAGVADGDVVQYVIEEGANFEIGTGTYTASGTTLTRTPSETSESDDSAITLAGQAKVAIVAVHADYNRLQYDGTTKAEATSTGVTVTGTLAATAVTGDGSALTGIEGVPSGVIVMWSGSIATIPTGWVICDGTNGTPNLTDRFVIHADSDSGGTRDVGDTGGASTVTLTTSELPSHTHSGASHTHSFSGNTSSYTINGGFEFTDNNYTDMRVRVRTTSGNFGSGGVYANYINSSGVPGGQYASGRVNIGATHSHSFSGTTGSGGAGDTGATGSGSAHENLPPYYALAYIMKS